MQLGQPVTSTRPITYAETIVRGAARHPDAVALICDDERRTWRDLLDRSARAAQGMLESGVQPQERVAYLGKNCLEFFEILYGASMVGAVPAGINWRLSAKEILAIINDTQAPLVFAGKEFVPVLDEIAGELAHVRKVVVIDADATERGHHEPYDDWLARQRPDVPDFTPSADDIAMQTYTSGTTGLPKGVMHTVAAIAASFMIAEPLEISDRTVALIATPVFHATAAAAAAMVFSAGGRCVVAREADPEMLLGLIEEHKITLTILVPTIIRMIMDSSRLDDHDLSSLQTLAYAASPIPPELLARARQRLQHVRFIQIYGSTETLGVTVLAPEEHAEHSSSAGRPLPGVTVRIVDPATGEDVLGSGASGELWVKTPTMMTGYWNMDEATRQTITPDGYVKTGDVGMFEDGYLILLDRVKDMIISGGENIYPVEVENVLHAHPLIDDAAVIGVPSERWGETVLAVVVPVADAAGRLTETDVIDYTRAHLARYKCPTSVVFADALPRNPSGKVLKTVLRQPFWGDRERRIN